MLFGLKMGSSFLSSGACRFMCGLYFCSVKNCCRDYKLRLNDNIVVFVHALDPYERFRVEFDLLWFEGSKTVHLPREETIDVKWGRLDLALDYDDDDFEQYS